MNDKQGRVALVTGAARRIGRAIVEMLTAEGYRVAVHYRANKTAADGLVQALNREAGRAVAKAFAADFRNEAEASDLVPRVTTELGDGRTISSLR